MGMNENVTVSQDTNAYFIQDSIKLQDKIQLALKLVHQSYENVCRLDNCTYLEDTQQYMENHWMSFAASKVTPIRLSMGRNHPGFIVYHQVYQCLSLKVFIIMKRLLKGI